MMNREKVCDFEALLTEVCHPPVISDSGIDSWPARHWTLKYLAERLKSTQLQCKISSTDYEDVLMETDCLHVQCSLHQYEEWLSGQPGEDNPLLMFDPVKYSCYVDYKYMKAMFTDCPDILKDVNWENFGFPGRDGTDSTIWIGSAGAYTPCHQDTYGFNLVAQITGRKRWYLFPPSASDYMYPTRIPFEESSVFSEVNVRYPDTKKHPLFQRAEPHVVILSPGEVLYVPRHWWHFVECLEPCISVNTWVEMREDTETHLEEAVTRFLFTSMAALVPAENVLNSYEELEPPGINIQYIQQALTAVMETRNEKKLCSQGQSQLTDKIQKLASGEKSESLSSPQLQPKTCCSPLPENNFQKFMEAFKDHKVTVCSGDITTVRSCSQRQNKRKRYSSGSVQDEEPNLYDSVAREGGESVCSKVAKHATQHEERDLNNPSTDGENCSKRFISSTHLRQTETTEFSEICVHSKANKGNRENQDSELLTKRNCYLKTPCLCTVPKFSFDDYIEFLKLEFDYDKTEYIHSDHESCEENLERDTQGTKSAENDTKATEKYNIDIMNSMLDRSVVQVICQNLLKKCNHR